MVSYAVHRSGCEAALLGITLLAGWVTQVVWMVTSLGMGVPQISGVLLCLATGGFAAWHWRSGHDGILNWNGTHWNWNCQGATAVVTPEVILDFQQVVLLRLHAVQGYSLWVWPQKNTAPEHWLALRRALFCPLREAPRRDGTQKSWQRL